MSESSSDMVDLDEPFLIAHSEVTMKTNCNSSLNNPNSICMGIETDV